jgi:uncharacterized membrane protein
VSTQEALAFFHVLFVMVGFAGILALHPLLAAANRGDDIGFVRGALSLARRVQLMLGIPGLFIGGVLGVVLSLYQEWDFGDNTWLNLSASLWVFALGFVGLALLPLNRLIRLADASAEVTDELRGEMRKRLAILAAGAALILMLVILYMMVAKPGVDFTGVEHLRS